MQDSTMILLWDTELELEEVSFTILASRITNWTFLTRCHFWKKWESTDTAQFLTASLRVGRISNILVEINFSSKFRWDSHIDARHYFGHLQSKNAFEV